MLNKANIEKIKVAEKLLSNVPDTIKIFREASEQGALFGSVTSRDVVNEINNDEIAGEIEARIIVNIPYYKEK